MATNSDNWKRAPIVEVVLGVQFAPLQKFTNGHLGWLWHQLKSEYPDANDAAPVPPVIERFAEEPEFGIPGIGLATFRGESRLRMVSRDGSRMVQVQNGWLIVNWMKHGAQNYPGYADVLAEFERAFSVLDNFVASERLGEVRPDLWEVTYIDHIPRGTVWAQNEDISRVLPGLLGTCGSPRARFESLTGQWSFRLQPSPGRLALSLQTARSVADPSTDLLVLTSSCRGPISAEAKGVPSVSLNYGKSAVVETFMAVSSEEARAYWKG